MRRDASRLRQRIASTFREQQQRVDALVQERGPLIRGSFGTRSRVCGNPGCHCAQGEPHVSKYITATDGGKVRQVHVPHSDELEVAAGVTRYRRFHRARADLADLAKLQVELADELGRTLLKPYPPNKPLPPATRRGRRPKDGGRQ